MVEVIIDGTIAKNKLFDVYYAIEDDCRYIVPKNDEIRKHCEFFKKIFLSDRDDGYHENKQFLMEITDDIPAIKDDTIYGNMEIPDNTSFIFEFPDEETALYFKLKYC